MSSAATAATAHAGTKHDRRRLRRLEQELAEARVEKARRSARLERARRDGGRRKIERRSAKLDRVRVREEELAARIAKLQTPAGPAASAAPPVLAYCLRDRARVEVQGPESVTMRNGQPALAGRCPTCGMRLVRAVARGAAAAGT